MKIIVSLFNFSQLQLHIS